MGGRLGGLVGDELADVAERIAPVHGIGLDVVMKDLIAPVRRPQQQGSSRQPVFGLGEERRGNGPGEVMKALGRAAGHKRQLRLPDAHAQPVWFTHWHGQTERGAVMRGQGAQVMAGQGQV